MTSNKPKAPNCTLYTISKSAILNNLFFLLLLFSPQSVFAKIVVQNTATWDSDSDYVLLDNGETIHLQHDPCKATSFLEDIPLTMDEYELFFEHKPTNVSTSASKSHVHTLQQKGQTHQSNNPKLRLLQNITSLQSDSISPLNKGPLTDPDTGTNDIFNSNSATESSSQHTNDDNRSHSRRRRAATAIRERLWPDGIIPYVIEGNFTGDQRAMFNKAMRHWENHTCITFVKRTTQTDYIVFTHRSCGCCSYVGRKGDGSQAVSVGKNCDKFGVVVHELGHVVGFWHEHTRPDRDLYITVKYENIMEGQQYNFEKLKPDAIDSLGEPYDYGSIMHYSANTFSKNGYLPTIETSKDKLTSKPRNIGQRVGLSEGDIRQTNKLYKCKLCGRSLLESEGAFASPGYPEQYGDNLDCEWRISVTSGEKIGLNISDFDFRDPIDKSFDPCEFEYLEIRDGHDRYSRLIGRYCYPRQPPNYLKSSGSRLWIRFKAIIFYFHF